MRVEEQFLKALAESIRPVERMSLYDWVRKYRRTEKGRKFVFSNRPYLALPYREAGQHKVEVIKKAAQTGGTEYAISRALQFAIDDAPVTIIYTFPTDSDMRDFVAGRLNPSIANSPYIREKLGRVNSVRVKELAGSFIYLRGTFSEREALSIPADALIHDEVDFSNQERLSEYEERLTASKFGHKLYFSTPTLPNFGIDAMYEKSDQGEWFLDCRYCDWSGIPEVEMMDEGPPPALRCPKCGQKLWRNHGHWEFLNPDSGIRGYHFDQLSCPFIDLKSIIAKLSGPKAYSKKQFENLVRGRACAVGVGQVNRGIILRNCFTDGVKQSDAGTGRFMGVDQNAHMSVVISEVVEGKRHIVQILEYEDDDDWSETHRLMHLHGVQCCVIDLRPEARLARKFAMAYPGRVYACEFVTTTKELFFDREEDWLVKGSRSQILDGAAAEIKAGKVQLYPVDENVEKYIQHWENLSRSEEVDRLGRPTIKWVKTGPSHLSFADAYNRLAVLISLGDVTEGSPVSTHIADTVERATGSFLHSQW